MEGKIVSKCKFCGKVASTKKIAKTGHKWTVKKRPPVHLVEPEPAQYAVQPKGQLLWDMHGRPHMKAANTCVNAMTAEPHSSKVTFVQTGLLIFQVMTHII